MEQVQFEKVYLVLGQVNQRGTRQHPLGEGNWWLTRSGCKRRQRDMQRQSHSQNEASGLRGKIWSTVKSLGGTFGKESYQLHHQSHLRCSFHTKEPKPVGWRRSLMRCLPNSSNIKAHSHKLQSQSVSRPLLLEAQSGPSSTASHSRRKESYRQCSPSDYALTPKYDPLCESRTVPSKNFYKRGSNPPRHC